MNRSLNIFGAALLSVVLAMGCNHSTASNAAAASNADQNGSKKGLQGSLFETRKEITIPESSLFEVTLDETLASNRTTRGISLWQASRNLLCWTERRSSQRVHMSRAAWLMRKMRVACMFRHA